MNIPFDLTHPVCIYHHMKNYRFTNAEKNLLFLRKTNVEKSLYTI